MSPAKRAVFTAAIIFCLALRSIASAGGPLRDAPPSAVSWWRFDPARFASVGRTPPERAMFLATIRAAIASGLFGDGTSAKIIEGVLAASDVGAVPHTLSLFSFSADRPESGTGVDITDLRMVLELHTPANHDRYVRTLRAIVVDAERAKTGSQKRGVERQRLLDLPDGTKAAAFWLDGWPGWREVSWASREDSFVIALGKGALEMRFADAAGRDAPPWQEHLGAVDESRPEGEPFFEAYLDIGYLRRAFPEAFVRGRTPRMAEALRLRGAGELMLHGRFIAGVEPGVGAGTHAPARPMLALDTTTRPRGGGPIEHHAVSMSTWSADEMPIPAPEGSYVIAATVD